MQVCFQEYRWHILWQIPRKTRLLPHPTWEELGSSDNVIIRYVVRSFPLGAWKCVFLWEPLGVQDSSLNVAERQRSQFKGPLEIRSKTEVSIFACVETDEWVPQWAHGQAGLLLYCDWKRQEVDYKVTSRSWADQGWRAYPQGYGQVWLLLPPLDDVDCRTKVRCNVSRICKEISLFLGL